MIPFYIIQRTIRKLMKSLRVSKDCKGGGKLTFLNILPRRRNLSLKKKKKKKKHHGRWALKPALLTLENASFPVRLGLGVVVCQGTDESFAHLQLDSYRHASRAHVGDRYARVSTRRPAGESVFPWVDGMVLDATRADSAHGPVSPTC